jgi:CheY-like chemotaxis protein
VITKRLAELMGGSVGFRSTPLEGSEFWVDLPVHAGAKQDEGRAPSAPRASTGLTTGSKHLVLYVEDNGANVLFMKDLLSSFEGCELISVPTAEMGIELARSRPPTVIIMDINLPGMSGLDALRALRTYPETRDIPVIALTAAASERDRQRGELAGFYRYLTKPVKVDEFEAALEELLQGEA